MSILKGGNCYQHIEHSETEAPVAISSDRVTYTARLIRHSHPLILIYRTRALSSRWSTLLGVLVNSDVHLSKLCVGSMSPFDVGRRSSDEDPERPYETTTPSVKVGSSCGKSVICAGHSHIDECCLQKAGNLRRPPRRLSHVRQHAHHDGRTSCLRGLS